MTARTVCAVIVSYHPSPEMVESIPRVMEQVQGLVVVDNGSNPDELKLLRETARAAGVHLIENRENLGIAEALNQGIRWATSKGYPWVILFDQDSRITDGFIDRMFATLESHPEHERIGSIHPRYVHPDTGLEKYVSRADDKGPITSITSGALMPIWVFEKIGDFASEYFIDWVDIEFSYRIRAAGFLIVDSRDAVLLHAAGHPRQFSFLGFHFRPGHHSSTRWYYMSRNRIAVYRKYLRVFPVWILKSMGASVKDTIKSFIVEDDRLVKLRNFMLGTWDGVIGRMGKREGI
jgi:rhamnosyltransferase